MRSKCRGLVTIFEATSTEEPACKFFVYQQPTITGDTAAYLGLVLIILAPVFLKVKSTAHSLTVSKTSSTGRLEDSGRQNDEKMSRGTEHSGLARHFFLILPSCCVRCQLPTG